VAVSLRYGRPPARGGIQEPGYKGGATDSSQRPHGETGGFENLKGMEGLRRLGKGLGNMGREKEVAV